MPPTAPAPLDPIQTSPAETPAAGPRLIALDVDGTLVNHHGDMSFGVREAGRALASRGDAHVVVATGRGLYAALPIAQEFGIESGYIVASNGGVTARLDPALDGGLEVLERVTFRPARVILALREQLPTANFAVEDEHGQYWSTLEFQDASFGVPASSLPLEELAEKTAVRVVVFSTDSSAEEFGEAVESIGLHGVTYSVGWTAWLDIAASGTTKASALENLRRRIGVDPADTVAMGDGRNDIEMLEWAARGVAMGQAPEEVKAAADEVTGSVDDDGAARILRQYLS
ncbi:HAD family hydrolase [Falsarthrobacter nasiphocae]|uniref:Cof subfamily protein (Haloacid dehalogenase superfamily) n=1 Tax=Falsarthrobacter nasiphocae TaxID=189863 RepID=A0AAE4C553_9MICC|nr:HAD family hydrolase [Falsarthrobacter nasiphocae]MDR6891996.1 Cof subfamily protein (haloacid dehalogenase superfamily) [Falsarthrobacter nasiphocae]